MQNQLDEKGHNVSTKCAIYVAVTEIPYHYSEGPLRVKGTMQIKWREQ